MLKQCPRYDFVWALYPVITHLYPHTNLSFKTITEKLISLLTLATSQKMQRLAAIRSSNIISFDFVVVKISDRFKTSRIGKSQPHFQTNCRQAGALHFLLKL